MMAGGQPTWIGDDFSVPFRRRVLDGILPLVLACISFTLLFTSYAVRRAYKILRQRRRRSKLIGLPRHHHSEGNGNGNASPGAEAQQALPVVIIETEAEHGQNDSHDLMLEAENVVIRQSVKEQGIVWPSAFKALGLLKEKENHHIKPTVRGSKYLQVPEDGRDHDADSWIQFWRSAPNLKNSINKQNFYKKRASLGKVLMKMIHHGKKDFIQSNLAWTVVALLFVKFAMASKDIPDRAWVLVPAIVWTYLTLLLEVRQFTNALHRSPFEPRKYRTLTYHACLVILPYAVISSLDLRSTLLTHNVTRKEVAIQASITALSLAIVVLEVFTPQKSNFIRKSELLKHKVMQLHSRSPSPFGEMNGNGNRSATESTPLLGSQNSDLSSDDEFDDEEAEYLAAIDFFDDESEDEKEKPRHVPPFEIKRSLASLATFTFMDPFLMKHARTPATIGDVPDLRADDKTASIVLEFRASCRTFPRWLRRKGPSGLRKRPPIFAQILWYFLPLLSVQCAWAFFTPWIRVLQPVFIKLILTWATDRSHGKDVKVHVAMLYVAGLFLSQMVNSLAMCRALIIGRRLSIRAKALVIAEVFTKTLRRKDLAGKALVSGESKPSDASAAQDKDGEGQASAGRVQNLVSVDASRISELFAYIHFFFPEAPLTLTIALIMLFNLIGFSAFAALACMIALFPFQAAVARYWMKFQNEVLAAADDRLSLTTEVFQAIKAIKFFAWEDKFREKLDEKRHKEIVALRKRVLTFAAGGIVMFGAPILISLVTFLCHTKLFHQPLDATTAFTALSLFNIIRAPLDQVADQISQVTSTLISCRRVDELLEEEETAKYAVVAAPSTASDPKVGFVNAAFTWGATENAETNPDVFKLQNLNLRFPLDGLSLVVGSVGSGKSSLLYALLGEMNLLHGRCFIPSPLVREAGLDPAQGLADSVAFCAQTPWLLNDTIRANILFGSAYNEKRYRHVLYACALLPDLSVMDLGDKTEVGEKGTVLSGGQKARISLARAVYSSAKVLLLDDVLSAVDAHTAKHLYHNCLTSDKLMRGRTRILVTHALHLTIPHADYVVALSNGHVAFDGPAGDYVIASGANTPGLTADKSLTNLHLKLMHKLANTPTEPPMDAATVADAAADAVAEQTIEQHLAHLNNPLSEEVLLTKAEKATTGAVSFKVYTFYAAAAGSPLVLTALFGVIIFSEAISVSANWALKLWASSFDNLAQSLAFFRIKEVFLMANANLPEDPDPGMHGPDYYLKYYVTLGLSALLLYGFRTLFFQWLGTVASKKMYTDVMRSLLAAPVRFYDQTPVGRIMNRLSKDMETIDQEVPATTMFFVLEIFATMAVLFAIALAVPVFLIAGFFISIIYTILGWLYIASSRELKRIEAVTRSPVYGLVGECLMGVTSIRAYSDASRFTASLFDLVDDTNRPFYALWLTNRWLSVRSDLGGAIAAFLTGTFIVFSPSVSASLAGFALTYALVMEERILWIVRLYSGTQIQMNSVERVQEYTLELPQEPSGKDASEPPAYWPSSSGGIEVEDLEVKYSEELAPALKGLSFTVKPCERVAIVGRTGSGKSTLALSFFRFVEASRGKILIDGIDISTVPLHTLRDRLTIIPQDAALFAGTIRFNLDPFGYYSDAELYDVLKRTNLLSNHGVNNASRSGTATPASIRTTHSATIGRSGGITSLDDMVQEGAKNFSAGQRQLLCLARGLLKLRRSNLLVLDESTANLDHETDVAVQKTIREEIGSATILCIAHRLHTIIDFDRVLVLGHGRKIEYDTPANLLRRGEDSEFYRLCQETGDFDQLKETADQHEREVGGVN